MVCIITYFISGRNEYRKENHQGTRFRHGNIICRCGNRWIIWQLFICSFDRFGMHYLKGIDTLTLGEANSITSPIYKKEAANTDLHPGTGEGPSVGRASFNFSVPQFIENFNEKHGILLKHFPDAGMHYLKGIRFAEPNLREMERREK